MRILLLNQTFFPDTASTAQHLSDLAQSLVQRSHQVTVVCSRIAYDNPETRFPRRETWKGIEIVRISSLNFGKGSKWRRAVTFASFMVSCSLRLLITRKVDVIVALTSPPLISFLAALFSRVRKARFVYWVMDLNPDEAVAAGWLRCGSWTQRTLECISRMSLQSAECVVALDRFMESRILQKGVKLSRLRVSPPWAHDDSVRFDPTGRKAFREKHKLAQKFVVMYSGNHSPCHPLTTMLDAARRLRTDPRFHFCFIGGGSEWSKIDQMAQKEALSNVTCLPYEPLSQLGASLSAADLHVISMGDPFVGLIHPCKIYNVLVVGCPFIYVGPPESHVADILSQLPVDAGCIRIAHNDPEAFVQHLIAEAKCGRELPLKSLQAVGRRFGQAKLVEQFCELLEQCK